MTNRPNRGNHRHSKAPFSNGKVAVPSRDDSQMPAEDYSRMHHRYYIVRPEPNKTCVPMIAVDELPRGFHLKGVPMTVTPQQIQEWDMARVGADVKLEYSFEVNFEPLVSSRRGRQSGSNTKNQTLSKATAIANGTSTDTTPTDEEVGSNKSDTRDKPESVRVNTKNDQHPTSELQQQANVCKSFYPFLKTRDGLLTTVRTLPRSLLSRVSGRRRMTGPRLRTPQLLEFTARRNSALTGSVPAIVTICRRAVDTSTSFLTQRLV